VARCELPGFVSIPLLPLSKVAGRLQLRSLMLQVGNQETMSVVSFAVDNESGKLSYASTIETAPFKACNISYVS
jgi:hypothetical protein